MSAEEDIIIVEGLSKKFHLRKQKPFIVHEIFRQLLTRQSSQEDFWALQNVSFRVQRGSSVGIIGGNGAGKSTLLSLLIGASKPTKGSVSVQGKIGALLELGAGFHPDLTGRENIVLNASLSGLSQATIESKIDSIISFSELGEFIDVPIRNYSSGMHVRLGFAVAVHVDPEILIIDEALSVGDADFQKKSLNRINEIKAAGTTFLVVSHALDTIRSLCDQAVWLEHGTVKAYGDCESVCDQYENSHAAPPGG